MNEKIIVIWNSQLKEILGEQKVEKVKIETKIINQEPRIRIKEENKEKDINIEELDGKQLEASNGKLVWEMLIDGVFVAIGHEPNSKVFPGIDTDEKGYIKASDHTKTNIPGVYVAGDVHDKQYKQAITAAGLGCMAALDVEQYLQQTS